MTDNAKKLNPLEQNSQGAAEDVPFEFTLNGERHTLKPVLRTGHSLLRIPVECIPINMPLPCPLYVFVNGSYVLFRLHNDQLSAHRIRSFLSKGTNSVYILKIFWKRFLNSIEELVLPEGVPDDDKLRHARALLMAYVGKIDHLPPPPGNNFFEQVRNISDWLAEELNIDPAKGLKFLHRNPDPNLYFENHALNSGIYSVLMGKSLHYSLQHLKILMFGGILHDVGNVFLPKEILFKEGKLTPVELSIVKTHCQRGAELLKSTKAEPEVIQMALQHHERVDSMGYPEGISGKTIHPFSKIVAISDVYDAMTCNRPHQNGLSSKEAMRRMRSQEGLFDLEFLGQISFGPK